ncbi:MAG TPA: tryptophan--tRNA ligase [Rudaea sp.]|nr:tryptophan--tRNA ligase [Rudaea sp.]
MANKTRVLTGITTSGTPHLGNYVGAIRPAIAASQKPDVESFFFLADYHALIKTDDPARIQRSTLEIAASWLACGLDPEKVYFYRQSDIPEIPELTWLLTCVTAKGLLNRAHAYKAANDANRANGEDPDAGVTAGLYMYPVLMAADILIFNANKVPVGRDQVQHIEMARDIGQRFNYLYGGGSKWDRMSWDNFEFDDPGKQYFVLPEAMVEENAATLPGLDGRKMSKSYNNTIPLFEGGEKALEKAIMQVVTDSSRPENLEQARGSVLYQLIEVFQPRGGQISKGFNQGDVEGWGTVKKHAFQAINNEIAKFRPEYERLMANPQEVEDKLRKGAERVRAIARERIAILRDAVGLRDLRRVEAKVAKVETRSEKPMLQAVVFRGEDKLFAFKVVDAKKNVVAEKGGFTDPKAAKDAGQSALDALANI